MKCHQVNVEGCKKFTAAGDNWELEDVEKFVPYLLIFLQLVKRELDLGDFSLILISEYVDVNLRNEGVLQRTEKTTKINHKL